jgi:hypothetical protein
MIDLGDISAFGYQQPNAFFSLDVSLAFQSEPENCRTQQSESVLVLFTQIDVRLGLRLGKKI